MTQRHGQIALGVLWLLDGLLQFQSFMYTHAFVRDVLAVNATGQPEPIATSILSLTAFYGNDLPLWNSLAAELQCAIGLGLIVSPRSVRPALAVGLVWSLIVWWAGEGFGGILTSSPLSPLMGAPGAALLYGLMGVLMWPSGASRERPPAASGTPGGRTGGRSGGRSGGRTGRRTGGRTGELLWSALWLEAAVLWSSSAPGSPAAELRSMAAASPQPLRGWDRTLAAAVHGSGATVVSLLMLVSLMIGLGVWTRLRKVALIAGIALSACYWVFGQALGGPLWSGTSIDVNSAPLVVLLAACLRPSPLPRWARTRERRRERWGRASTSTRTATVRPREMRPPSGL
ncbi:MAG: hypothetical protein M0T77_04355 [Actinomycetota bacterium]|nr:hypothetical protein [Actinomycetota bacterium]